MKLQSLLVSILPLVAGSAALAESRSMMVTVTAYNSVAAQTDGTPRIGACGKRIPPEKNVIAVSRDFFDAGIDCRTEVAIEGFEENFIVMDKMNDRFQKRIDIHMGKKMEKAEEGGEQERKIWWYAD